MYNTIKINLDFFSPRYALPDYEDIWTRDIGQYIREESHEACIEGGGTLFTLQPPFTGHTLIAGLSDEEKIERKLHPEDHGVDAYIYKQKKPGLSALDIVFPTTNTTIFAQLSDFVYDVIHLPLCNMYLVQQVLM